MTRPSTISCTSLEDVELRPGATVDALKHRVSELERQVEAMALIREIATAANDAESLDDALQVSLDRICEYFACPLGHVWVQDDGNGELVSSAIWHIVDTATDTQFRQAIESTRIGPAVGLAGQVLSNGEPAWVMQITEQCHSRTEKLVEDLGVQTCLGFRVLAGNQVVAVFECFSNEVVSSDPEVLQVLSEAGIQLNREFERRRAEEDLRVSEARFKYTARMAKLGHWTWGNLENKMLDVWEEFAEIFGLSVAQCLGSHANPQAQLDLVHPGDRERYETLLAETEKKGRGYDIEYRLLRSDGKVRTVREIGEPVFNRHGRLIRTVGATQDISDRREVERALRDSEAQFRHAAKLAKLAHWAWDEVTHKYVHISDEYAYMSGYDSVEECLAASPVLEHDMRAVHPDDRERYLALLEDAREHGAVVDTEYRIVRPDGEIRHVREIGEPVFDETGRLVRSIGTMQDITEAKETAEALRLSETRLKEAAKRAKLGYWVWDEVQDKMVAASEEYAAIIGISVEQALEEWHGYEKDLTLVHPEDVERYESALDGAERKDWEVDIEYRLLKQDGQIRWVRETSHPISKDENGRVIQTSGILQDITERKLEEEKLRIAKEEADRSSQAKSEFVANMSHEIRTPINGVLGMTELLLNTDLSEKQRRFLDAVYRSGQALLSVINNVLDFSKIEAGKLELDDAPFDLREIVEDVCELFAQSAHAKELELVCDTPTDLPYAVRGDAGRVRQVLTNLVGNAIKFTAKGEVVVRVGLASQHDNSVSFRFEVQDTGAGIDPAAREKIFDSFSQADSSTTRKYGGTGLGLTISRQLTELMHGQMDVESESGQGSVFSFTIRLEREPARTAEIREGLGCARILVVDDNATNREVLHHQLESWGVRCVLAESAEEALSHLRKAVDRNDPFQLALLDQQMPVMDGLELTRAIKVDPVLADVALVMLSSVGLMPGNGDLRAQGLVSHLTKPVRQSQLYDCLAVVLHGRTAEVTPAAREPSQAHQSLDTFDATVLLVEDNPVNAELARAMLEVLGCQVDTAENGRVALDAMTEREYVLVLMDCNMPEMDGYEATRELRRREQSDNTGRVPIIALTAAALEGDRERCVAAGMDDYLSKPFTQNELGEILTHWIGDSKKESDQ